MEAQRILTAHGLLDRALLVRDRILVDNHHERTLNLEYRLKAPLRLPNGHVVLPDEIVKRSAHVRLKTCPEGMELALGAFLGTKRNNGPGITPTGIEPDSVRMTKHLRSILGRGGYRFANSQAGCTQFKIDLFNGLHAFGTSVIRGATTKDSFKMALFLTSASLGAATTVYSTTGELAGSGNYTKGGTGVTNANAPTSSGTTAYWTPLASVSWANLTSSGSFDAALLYNDTSASKLAVAVFTFGAQSITSGTFTLTMPTNDSSNAMLRIA